MARAWEEPWVGKRDAGEGPRGLKGVRFSEIGRESRTNRDLGQRWPRILLGSRPGRRRGHADVRASAAVRQEERGEALTGGAQLPAKERERGGVRAQLAGRAAAWAVAVRGRN